MHKVLTVVAVLALIAGCGVLSYRIYTRYLMSKINSEVTIETGSSIDITLFAQTDANDAVLVTDVSGIDTTVPASYIIKVRNGSAITVTKDVILNIIDSTAPTAVAVPQDIYTDGRPPAQDTVTQIEDLAQVTVAYVNEMPEVLEAGQYDVPVSLTDAS